MDCLLFVLCYIKTKLWAQSYNFFLEYTTFCKKKIKFLLFLQS